MTKQVYLKVSKQDGVVALDKMNENLVNTSFSNFLKGFLVLSGIFMMGLSSFAQEWKTLEPDQLYEFARNTAFEGDRDQAREMLHFLLEEHADFYDARILLARTYAWDGEHARADNELREVLRGDPENKDALNAFIDNQIWGAAYHPALETVNRALELYPAFEDFLYKKVVILNHLEQNTEASMALANLLQLYPAHEKALELQKEMAAFHKRYKAGVRVSTDFFSESFDPAFYGSVQIERANSWGSAIIRGNYARRFGSSGLQGEVDLYPRLTDGIYAYVNYGYSGSLLFPEHRFGAEVFSRLPKGFEGSIGFRHMIFMQRQVTIYTGAVGWYVRRMWWSMRPYVTPEDQVGTSVSISLTTRRYFDNPLTYLEIRGGMGYSPDVRTIQTAQGFTDDQIFSLQAQRLATRYQKLISSSFLLAVEGELTHQELAYALENYMWIYGVSVVITYRF